MSAPAPVPSSGSNPYWASIAPVKDAIVVGGIAIPVSYGLEYLMDMLKIGTDGTNPTVWKMIKIFLTGGLAYMLTPPARLFFDQMH